ncbi:hypothetical protein P4576_17075 [Peribacillus frigoritolerans]|uniref:hypothetical protein n=1 Tax=Peribacillus frigoritolerans TaxID=450367 RepID=UPI002E24C28A|nr:hypothetical protein [Peribacillus frigoritolerans]
MDIDSRLKELEESIDENLIDLYDSDIISLPIKLAYFELSEYRNLIIELNIERLACKTYKEKKGFIEKYKKIYLSERKIYKRILRNINKGTAKINHPFTTKKEVEYFYKISWLNYKFDKSKTFDNNLLDYMKSKLCKNIYLSNQELCKLKNYPEEYTNTLSTFIGPSSVSKYRQDIITYKDVYIAGTESNSFSVFYNEHSSDDTKNALLNILAYFNAQPSFYFTENYNFNKKLYELYEQFDLLDMLRLRKKNFFDSKQEEPFHLDLPIFKEKNGYKLICFEDSKHEMIFELYHASLKQFESLPRCVFLYRVFEYGAVKHYQPLMKPKSYKPEDALNYYVNEIMNHRYNPLYYADLGTYINSTHDNVVRKRKAKYVNFTTKLKEEAKIIKKEWSNHSYLKNKSIGSIIYSTGRNAAAHGGGGRGNARYDYSMNYKHINDVNIFLELISRYIIEKLNPQFTNIVERRTKYYIKYNDYKIFDKQNEQ